MAYAFEKIDHVQLAAPLGGEKKAREFYLEILGFLEVEKPAVLKKRGGVWFRKGKIELHIGVEDPFVPAKKAHPAFRVKGINSLKEYISKQGIKIVEDSNLPGANRFYVHDPFGNRLEFLEWQSTK